MLSKIRWHAHFQFSANRLTWSGFLIQIHRLNEKQCLQPTLEGSEWRLKIFHDQSPWKNVARPNRDWTCDLLITSRRRIRLSLPGQRSADSHELNSNSSGIWTWDLLITLGNANLADNSHGMSVIFFEKFYIRSHIILIVTLKNYEGPAKSFVTGFGLLQCYVLSNIFLLHTFKVFPLYWNTFFNLFTQSRKADK